MDAFVDPELADLLRSRTTARIAIGRAGTRSPTLNLLELRADHAAARDAVLSEVPPDFANYTNCASTVSTRVSDRREHLLRPDLGRLLRPEDEDKIRQLAGRGCDVLVAFGDGLSSEAVTAQVPALLPALFAGLALENVGRVCGPVMVRYTRVGLMNQLGELAQASVVVLLVGERPGLSTSRSLSAYLGWEPRPGKTDADRNVVSNIHEEGLPAHEAGAQVAKWAVGMLRQRTSGYLFAA
jgi:ethanolamine ammonia-lyase small subunit